MKSVTFFCELKKFRKNSEQKNQFRKENDVFPGQLDQILNEKPQCH